MTNGDPERGESIAERAIGRLVLGMYENGGEPPFVLLWEGDVLRVVPFGITHEDVRWLREYADSHAGVTGEAAIFASIADRIAAFLPHE